MGASRMPASPASTLLAAHTPIETRPGLMPLSAVIASESTSARTLRPTEVKQQPDASARTVSKVARTRVGSDEATSKAPGREGLHEHSVGARRDEEGHRHVKLVGARGARSVDAELHEVLKR